MGRLLLPDSEVPGRCHHEHRPHPDGGDDNGEAKRRETEGIVVERHAAQAHDHQSERQRRNRTDEGRSPARIRNVVSVFAQVLDLAIDARNDNKPSASKA